MQVTEAQIQERLRLNGFMNHNYIQLELVEDDHAMYNGWELAGMKLTFDELQRVKICELFFGEEDKIYFQWIYDENKGIYSLTTQYFDENGEYFKEYFGGPGVFIMPDDKDMFAYAFGQTVDALYPDNDGLYIQGDGDHSKMFVKYGSGSTLAFTVTHDKIYDAGKNADGTDYISVNAYMPDAETRVGIFMDNTPEWLRKIYSGEQAEMDMPLANVIVTIDPEGSVYCLELLFGLDETSYVKWMRAPDGTFYIAESGGSEIVD